jgi:flagellar biosynthesis component FlhA
MDLFEMKLLSEDLNRMSIAQLKAIMKNLLKEKTSEARSAIKIIKGIIDHKKGRLNLK